MPHPYSGLVISAKRIKEFAIARFLIGLGQICSVCSDTRLSSHNRLLPAPLGPPHTSFGLFAVQSDRNNLIIIGTLPFNLPSRKYKLKIYFRPSFGLRDVPSYLDILLSIEMLAPQLFQRQGHRRPELDRTRRSIDRDHTAYIKLPPSRLSSLFESL